MTHSDSTPETAQPEVLGFPLSILAVAAMSPVDGGQTRAAAGAAALLILSSQEDPEFPAETEKAVEADQESAESVPVLPETDAEPESEPDSERKPDRIPAGRSPLPGDFGYDRSVKDPDAPNPLRPEENKES